MTRAILANFRMYTPFGREYYQPIFTHFLKMLGNYADEFDTLYLLDSQWGITPEDVQGSPIKKIEHLDINPSLRYYDAYKEILLKIKENLFLLMDNDMIVYKNGIINETFKMLEHREVDPLDDARGNWTPYDVVSIIDEIGEYKTDKLKQGNKFCPYWFASRIDLIKKYLDVDWGPDMPYCETLGHLTEAMLKDNVKVYEWKEDKSSIYFDGTKDGEKGKDLGYYHIRAGTTPAYLLATVKYENPQTYWDYLDQQPKTELLRQCAWYQYMGGDPQKIVIDSGFHYKWKDYYEKFLIYHGLK